MKTSLIYLVIGLFAALVFLQFYFRIRVLKYYKRLVKNEVQFDASHIFNKNKLEEEIIPHYPKHESDIRNFVKEMRFSLQIASVLIVLITIAGMIVKNI